MEVIERVPVRDQFPRPGTGRTPRVNRQFSLTMEEDAILARLQEIRGDQNAVTTMRWVLFNLVEPYMQSTTDAR